MRRPPRLLLAASATAFALAGCSLTDDLAPSPAASTPGAPSPGVLVAMTTTTPLGSVTAQIAQCGGGTATTIMGIGDDPHTFQPSSAQVATMVDAPLVVASGLGLEESLLTSLASAEADGANVLEIGPLVDPLTFDETGGDDGHGHDAEIDPHWWLDVSRMATAASIIGEELAENTGNEDFAACGTKAEHELRALDHEIEVLLAGIPAQSRKLVTDHRAFGYFAHRYGLEMVGSVIPSASTDAEPSSSDLAELIRTIEELRVPAIFANVASPSSLADAVAAEVGFDVQVVSLFTESLGPEGSGATSYQDMMRTNATLIADALAAPGAG